MGGRKGKQKQKQNLNKVLKEAASANFSVAARNLHKADLGAVIFGTTYNTINECMTKNLFGLPKPHYSYIKNISQGLPLFLFNYSDRKLHGVFEATCPGQMHIDKYAWIGDEEERDYTSYPAQVRFCVRVQCQPLSENEFQPIIATNYYENKLFYFELDHDQTKKLIKLFKPALVHSTPSFHPIPTNRKNVSTSFPLTQNRQPISNLLEPNIAIYSHSVNPNQTSNFSYASVLGGGETTPTVSGSVSERKWSELFKSEAASKDESVQENTWGETWESDIIPAAKAATDKGDYGQENTWEESHPIDSSIDEAELGKSETWEDTWDESEPIHTSTNVADNGQASYANSQPLDGNTDCQLSDENAAEENDENDDSVAGNTVTVTEPTSTEFYALFEKVMQEVKALRGSQLKQIVKMSLLEEELVKSKQEIEELRNRIIHLESGSC